MEEFFRKIGDLYFLFCVISYNVYYNWKINNLGIYSFAAGRSVYNRMDMALFPSENKEREFKRQQYDWIYFSFVLQNAVNERREHLRIRKICSIQAIAILFVQCKYINFFVRPMFSITIEEKQSSCLQANIHWFWSTNVCFLCMEQPTFLLYTTHKLNSLKVLTENPL